MWGGIGQGVVVMALRFSLLAGSVWGGHRRRFAPEVGCDRHELLQGTMGCELGVMSPALRRA